MGNVFKEKNHTELHLCVMDIAAVLAQAVD